MKSSFVLYTEYAKHLSILSMEQRGVLFTAIMAYSAEECMPEMDGMTQMAFSFIREQLDRDKERYENTCKKRSAAGRQGGRPKEEGSVQEEKQKKQMLFEESKKSKCFSEKANESKEKQKNPDNEDENEDEDDNDIISPPSLRAGARDEGEELREFLQENGNIAVDNCSTASLDMDYPGLRRAFAESAYLREKPHDLSWVAKNAARILRGDYKDKPARSGSPPDGKGDLQLWQELVKALSCAKEETDYGALTYKMQDEESIERMGELYRGLSREITEYFDPNSFLELCGMDDKDLKFERARFLKALPEIRRKIAEVQDGA